MFYQKITAFETISVKDIIIERGIYQGDLLWPLLLLLALVRLSSLLYPVYTGYPCIIEKNLTSYQLLTDNLKLIAKDDSELETQLKIVKEFSDDICMEFGIEKCAKIGTNIGKILKRDNLKLDERTALWSLEDYEIYTYLGVEKVEIFVTTEWKRSLPKNTRTRTIPRSETT